MARKSQTSLHPRTIAQLRNETLYIGVDIGKFQHVAGFLSSTLLTRHERFEGCPTMSFAQSREGFAAFIDRVRELAPFEQAPILLEHTGHYHRLLEQYLLDLDITVYRIHVQKRPSGMMKTDKRDALRLANTLYTQLALDAQVADKMQLVRPAAPPSRAAVQLRGLTRQSSELSQEANQRRNKLTAICDELFPELTQVFHDPNAPSALLYRAQFSTPHAFATAGLPDLRALRLRNSFPSEKQFTQLQQLAQQTIGTKDVDRQKSLQFEQRQLIKELQLIREHLGQLEEEIKSIVAYSREGQILQSIPGLGPVQAATIIASIGSIANFEKASELKSYFGWAPQIEQTGVSADRGKLTRKRDTHDEADALPHGNAGGARRQRVGQDLSGLSSSYVQLRREAQRLSRQAQTAWTDSWADGFDDLCEALDRSGDARKSLARSRSSYTYALRSGGSPSPSNRALSFPQTRDVAKAGSFNCPSDPDSLL